MGMNEIIEKCTGRLECTFVSSLNSDEYYIAHTDAVGGFLSEDKEPLSQIVFAKNIIDDDRAMAAAFCRELISLKEPVSDDFALRENRYEIEFRIILDDMVRWVRLTCMVYCGDDNNPESIVGRMHFMTPSEIMKVRALQIHGVGKSQADYLEDIRALIDSCGAQRVVLVQFDIVNFKYINTQYSEKEGNEVLDYVSRKLDEMCGDSCVHFRMSADIFLVAAVFNGMSDVERIVYNIENDISECDGIRLRYAFGVYIAEDKSVSVRTMCDCASMARKSIKGNALQNVGYFSESLFESVNMRHMVEERMEYALEAGEFTVYLQPKYSIATEEIVGAEALVRWIHPEKGIISPGDFVPIFEQNGFIVKLDEFVWERVCSLLRKWIDFGLSPIPVSVNVSRIHLKNNRFIATFDRLIEKYGLDKHLLEIEITETIDNINAENMIKSLKERGYMLLMDDFGSGYSTLNMLKSTPFDIIKIDKEFLNEFMLSDRGKKIISHTISMSKDIGLGLVAEGVETKEQADFLCSCGCNVAQGFYYSKPIDIDAFEKMVFPPMEA